MSFVRLLVVPLMRLLDRSMAPLGAKSPAGGAPAPSAKKLECYARTRRAAAELMGRIPRHAAPKEAVRQLDYLTALETGASRDLSGLEQVELDWLAGQIEPLDAEVARLLLEADKEARNLSWYG